MSFPGPALSFPGQVLSFPGQVLSFPGQVLSFPGQVLSFPGQVLSFPGQVLSFPGQVLSFPGPAFGRYHSGLPGSGPFRSLAEPLAEPLEGAGSASRARPAWTRSTRRCARPSHSQVVTCTASMPSRRTS